MSITLDTGTEFGQRAQRHLEENLIVWLTTVDASGTPQPRPVWFVWDGAELLIYSRPAAHKVAHVRARPRVALNFDSDVYGGDVVVLTGEASLAPDAPQPKDNAPYVEKYAEGIADLGMTPESFGETYSVPIRVRPDNLRGH